MFTKQENQILLLTVAIVSVVPPGLWLFGRSDRAAIVAYAQQVSQSVENIQQHDPQVLPLFKEPSTIICYYSQIGRAHV